MITLTADMARRMLRVDPNDGKIYWGISHGRWGERPAGVIAGCLSNGYRVIHIAGKNHLGHRLAWLIAHGHWPDGTLDHINGHRDDNRSSNLRLATTEQNNQNLHGTSQANTSGVRGVSWDSSRSKWTVRISIKNRSINLGRFDDINQAKTAYVDAKRKHHPFSHEVML